MNRKPAAMFALLLVGACSGGGSGTDQAPAPVALVRLSPATQGSISQTTTLYGVAEPGAAGSLVLSAPTEAIIARIAAPVGSRVTRGQLIVQLAAAPNASLDLVRATADARVADAAFGRASRLRADGLVGNAEVETARAAAQSADATLASYRGRAGNLALKSPVAGFVASIANNPGDLVPAGTAVAMVTSSRDLRARFGVDPAVARALARGGAIRIMTGSASAPLSVPIQSIDPTVNPVTRLASVFALIPVSAGLAPGALLRGEVATQSAGSAITIPYAALLDDGGQPYVFVAANGIAHRRDVTPGPIGGDRVAISQGVNAGESVVTEGGTAVEDGMKVRTR